MVTNNKSNKITFGIGVFICLTLGASIIAKGIEIISGLGFLFGVYNIWQHGFVKDPTSWKIKPIYFVAAVCFILVALYSFIAYRNINHDKLKNNNVRFIDQFKINLDFPISMGDKDSAVAAKAIDDTTLEFKYKIHTNVKDMDSVAKMEFIKSTRSILLNKIASKSIEDIEKFRRNNINYKHIYLDSNLNEITTIFIYSKDY